MIIGRKFRIRVNARFSRIAPFEFFINIHHFEEKSLQRSFCRSVVLQGVQKEGCSQ